MKNIENSDITLDQIITIIDRVEVLGDDNAYRWFYPYRQYVFCDTAIMELSCHWCNTEDNPKQVGSTLHYKLCLDSVTYWIPDWAATVEGKLRADWEQDFEKYEERMSQQPKDFLGEYYALTGRRINTGEVECDGYDFAKKHNLTRPRLLDETPTIQGPME